MKLSFSSSDDITPDLQRRIKALGANKPKLLKAIGQAIVSDAKRAFSMPAMRPAEWAPLRPSTLAARAAKGRRGTKPLIDSGTLARSPRVVEVDANSVSVGSDRAAGSYSLAAIHQYGAPRRNIPARPFFPVTGDMDNPTLTPEADAKIVRLIERHVERNTQ